MADQTAYPRLTRKFVDALGYAADKHALQTRKASEVPYLGQLLSVAGLVIESDGTETQAIAALLHDAAEDQGGEELDNARAILRDVRGHPDTVLFRGRPPRALVR